MRRTGKSYFLYQYILKLLENGVSKSSILYINFEDDRLLPLYQDERHEIDFLIQTPNGQKKFFQVVWEMNDKKTVEREQRALQEGMKEMKIDGEIVTLDSYFRGGIKL